MHVANCKIGLCKKQHLTPAHADALFEALSWLYKEKMTQADKDKNKKKGDKCFGVKKGEDCKNVVNETNFWAEVNNEVRTFCSIECMLNYFVLRFCKRGQAPHNVNNQEGE